MDFKLLLLVLSITIGLSSCGDVKNLDSAVDTVDNMWKGKLTLALKFQKHKPYCGGAAPTPDQEGGTSSPIANQVFYIYKDERPASITQMTKVTTDADGIFSIDLKQGMYSVISGDKALPVDEFIKKKKIIDQSYTYSDDECFQTWRTTPDFTIDLTTATNELIVIQERCFTGDNPCMKYTGPYPP